MDLTAEQDAKFRELCREIKPGEYGKVTVSFTGEPSNVVQITGEKNFRYQSPRTAVLPAHNYRGTINSSR